MNSRSQAAPLEARRQSTSDGDLVLAVLPPFFGELWLTAGVVRIAHVLSGNGITPRIPRTLADYGAIAEEIRLAALQTLALDVAPETRRARTQALSARHPAFFDEILHHLLQGPETLFAFSVWRTNVDVTLEVCRQLRERRAGVRIVLGGPEAIERGQELKGPWTDCVVSGSGEDVIVPLARAFLDGRPGRGRGLAHTWIAPEHPEETGPLAPHRPARELGPVHFDPIFPLVMEDPDPRLPVVLNVGCVFNCGFCTNRVIYPEIEWGQVETCVEEVAHLRELWFRAWPESQHRKSLQVEFCDATINQFPEQFDELNRALARISQPQRDTAQGFRLGANWIVDRRVTAAVAEATAAAGFTQFFFGLESGSDRVRRAMKKPGTPPQVWDALRAANAASSERLHVCFGVIAGWPDETEVEHLETQAFLERVASLHGLHPRINVTPFIRTQSAQNRGLLSGVDGDTYGILWRSGDPAGDPALRARRTLSYLERFGELVRVDFPVPIDLLGRWMLPPESHPWLERVLEDHCEPSPPDEASRFADGGTVGGALEREALVALFALGPGREDQLHVLVDREKAEVSVLLPSGQPFLTFLLYPRRADGSRACYCRTRSFDVCLRGLEHSEEQLALADRLLSIVSRRESGSAARTATESDGADGDS